MKNTVSWSDIETTNRIMARLMAEMLSYHKRSVELYDKPRTPLHSDMSVLVECINLRNQLDKIIQKSNNSKVGNSFTTVPA